MLKKTLLTLLFLFLFIPSGRALAMHGSVSSTTGQAGPVTTVPAHTAKKGSVYIDVTTEFINFDTFSESRMLEFAANDQEIHNVDSLLYVSTGISYGITNNIMVHASIPYIKRSNIQESEPPDEIHDHGDAEGVGDISLHLHARLLLSPIVDLTLLTGIKTPTGRTDVTDKDGQRFEAEFQPGSGSWDPFLGLAASRALGRFSIDANALYTLVTEGTQNTDLGDRLNYNLAVSYQAVRRLLALDLILEGNGIWRAKEETNGIKDNNSGGNLILISPGLRVYYKDFISFYVSYGKPVLQNLNGTQNDIHNRMVFGVDILF